MEMKKGSIKQMINLEEKEGKRLSIERLQKRYKYLKSKNYKIGESNQMKYIKYHLKMLGAKL
jgi:hypothetical protein